MQDLRALVIASDLAATDVGTLETMQEALGRMHRRAGAAITAIISRKQGGVTAQSLFSMALVAVIDMGRRSDGSLA